jgi:hypothetical protein
MLLSRNLAEKRVRITASGLLLASATVQTSAATPAQEAFDTLYRQAEQAHLQAAAAGGEWRDVGKMLAKARQTADAGDLDEATRLASSARIHSELGHQQAMSQG